MDAGPAPQKPKPFRRKYLLDKPTQLRVMLSLVLGLAAIAISFVGALLVYFSPDGNRTLSGDEVRTLLMKVNWVYFGLAAIVLAELVLVLTHRFVGPAFVFRRALNAMVEGRYDERLSLRKNDFLHDVGDLISRVRGQWLQREEETRASCERLEKCLAEGDLDEARAIVASMKDGGTVQVAPAPRTASAPAREPVAV